MMANPPNPLGYNLGYRQAQIGSPITPGVSPPYLPGYGPVIQQQTQQTQQTQQQQQMPQTSGYEALVQALAAKQAMDRAGRYRESAAGAFAQRDTGKAALLGGLNSFLAGRQEDKGMAALKESARLEEESARLEEEKGGRERESKARAAAAMVLANGGSQAQADAVFQAQMAGLNPNMDGPKKEGPKMTDVNALQTQVNNTIGKDFRERTDAVRDVTKYAQGKTGFSDHALIFRYMKFLDPNSTVREGEFATVEQTGSIPDQVRVMYNKALSGDKLTDEQRVAVVSAVTSAYPQYVENFQRDLEPFKTRASNWGVDWEEISVPEPFNIGKAPKVTPADVADDTPPPPPPGYTMKKVNGEWIAVKDNG